MAASHNQLIELLAPENADVVCSLLVSSNVRIAVPCAVLSKQASGAGSKVVVRVLRRGQGQHATQLALECGHFWRGAPSSAVFMDYRQLLQHANDDAVQALHRKLAAVTSSRSRSLARTQSVPGRISLDELAGSSSGSRSGGASQVPRSLAGSSAGKSSAAGGLRRTTSGSGLPPTGAAGLRRTSSTGLPPPAPGGTAGTRSCPRPGGGSALHRLSASGLRRSGSLPVEVAAGGLGAAPPEDAWPGAAAGSGASTPEGSLVPPFSLPYEDSALGAPAKPARRWDSPGSPRGPVQHPQPSWESSGESGARPASAASSLFGGSTDGSPFGASSAASPADAGGASGSNGSGRALSRQPTFSQPYFAELEGESPPASLPASSAGTPPGAAPVAAPGSSTVRAAQLAAAEDQMTAEQLHEVDPAFHHVFVPPWAVPAPPQQATVRRYREAGVQTATGAEERAQPLRATHTEDDMADHYQAFMQHFGASLPHLAMALADLHLARGGDDPLFVKGQYYFHALLQLKDEMRQLGDRLAPPGRQQ